MLQPAPLRSVLAMVVVTALSPSSLLACTADLDGDVTVGFGDLTKMLSAWGPCGEYPWHGCAEDLTDDGSVGFGDLTELLSAWGPCSTVFACPQPFADPELQQIGLEALGPGGALTLSNDLYDRVERDVASIRAQYGLEGYLHPCAWVGREMLVGVDPKGTLDEFNALNEFYCASTIDQYFDGTMLHLEFPCNLNIPALAAEYEALTEAEWAEPNQVVGSTGASWIPQDLSGGVWQWTVRVSFWDCFDGCDCIKEFVFITFAENDEVMLVDETEVVGQPWCPEEIPGPPTEDVLADWRQLCSY